MGGDSRNDSGIEDKSLFERFKAEKKEDSSEFVYERMLENAMRYLNKSLYEAEKMTLREYSYEMHAHGLKEVDKERNIHLLAWQINQAQATKQKGKKTEAYFKDFREFFDYEKRIKALTGGHKENNSLAKLLSKANS